MTWKRDTAKNFLYFLFAYLIPYTGPLSSGTVNRNGGWTRKAAHAGRGSGKGVPSHPARRPGRERVRRPLSPAGCRRGQGTLRVSSAAQPGAMEAPPIPKGTPVRIQWEFRQSQRTKQTTFAFQELRKISSR